MATAYQPTAGERASSVAKTAAPLVALVSLDTLLKVVAYLALPRGEAVRETALLQAVLRVNSSGLGTWVFAGTPPEPTMGPAVAMLVLAGTVLVLRRWDRSLRLKIIVGIAVYLLVYALVDLIFGTTEVGSQTIVVTMRAAQTVLWTTLWWVAPAGPWKLGLLMFAAAATGNFLSELYPPYAPVDYLYSKPVTWLTGMGIFNLADVLYLAAFPILLIAALLTLRRRLKPGSSEPKVSS